MKLDFLLNETKLKKIFGPITYVGDKRIFLAEKPMQVIQGNGPNIGKVSLLIRFFGNNINYTKKKDDTFYTNNDLQLKKLPDKLNRVTFKDNEQFFEKIFLYNDPMNYNNVIFSGGEPMLFQLTIATIIRLCKDKIKKDFSFEIETNGSIHIDLDVSDFLRIPTFNIRVDTKYIQTFPLVYQFSNKQIDHNNWNVIFKCSEDRWESIQKVINFYNLVNKNIMLEPINCNNPKKCIEKCIKYGYNYSPKLHKLLRNSSEKD